jgi:hypothetical protein
MSPRNGRIDNPFGVLDFRAFQKLLFPFIFCGNVSLYIANCRVITTGETSMATVALRYIHPIFIWRRERPRL